MRTLQEKYNAVLEGTFSKEQFRRDAVMQLPNMVSKFNSFEDMTTILKNRGMLAEAKKEEVTAYKKPEVDPVDLIAPDLLDDGIKAELEAAGIEGTPSEEEYEKAKEKAAKNLAKDPLCYKNAQTMPEMGEKMEKVTLKEGKEQLLEMLASIIDKAKAYAKEKYPHFKEEDIKDFVRMHGKDIMKGAKLEAEFENFADANSNLDEAEGIELSAEDMEELRTRGKFELPDGRIIHYLGKPTNEEDTVNVDDFEKKRTNTRDFASTPEEREDGTYDISGMMGEAEAANTLADILKNKGTLDHLKKIERLRLKLIDGPFLKKNPDWKDKAVKFISYDARQGLVLIDLGDTSGFAYPSELVIDTEATNMSEGTRTQLKEAVKALIKKTLEA